MATSRRDFIKATGCLSIGFFIDYKSLGYPSPIVQELPGSLRRHPNVNAWLEVLSSGKVRIFTGKLELGQGIRTAIAQVAAEELNFDMEYVEVVLADTARTPNEGYTAGSGSIEGSAMAVRYAAAFARARLLAMAAAQMDTPVESLQILNGRISVSGTKKSIDITTLLQGKQLTDTIKLPVKLKRSEDYRLVGKPIARDDIGRMVRGEPVYVQDLRFPGMVHARIVRPPSYHAGLKTYDESAVKKQIPSLLKVVSNGTFLGVITEDEFQAMKAQQLMQRHCTWSSEMRLPVLNKEGLINYLRTLPVNTESVHKAGSISEQQDGIIRAVYDKPYIMHGSIGPSCAVALYNKEILYVWTHSQGVFPLREAIAKMQNLPIEKIQITGVPGSGCYGHNGADDVAAEAALLAMAYPGKHVRLQWSREEEHQWEPYGSAMIMEFEARLDSNGMIRDWKYDLRSDTHATRPGGNAENLLPAKYLEKPFTGKGGRFSGGAYRNAEPYYEIPNQAINAHFFTGPLRVSALRGLGAYANIFAIESFMDELAGKAGKDPWAFRLQHLKDERAKAVITKLKTMVPSATKPGNAIGIAFSRYKNSAAYCAVAAEVKVDLKKRDVQVLRMWAAIDAGEIINPDGLINQTEGGMIQSASWTLQEQVRFDDHGITSTNWDSYPIYRFSQVPEVEVAVIARPKEEPLGAGEAAQGPAAGAIANAVSRALGRRVRSLPVLAHIFTPSDKEN